MSCRHCDNTGVTMACPVNVRRCEVTRSCTHGGEEQTCPECDGEPDDHDDPDDDADKWSGP